MQASSVLTRSICLDGKITREFFLTGSILEIGSWFPHLVFVLLQKEEMQGKPLFVKFNQKLAGNGANMIDSGNANSNSEKVTLCLLTSSRSLPPFLR